MWRVLYMMQKEFRQIARDKSMRAILFVMPLIQLLLLGNAVTTDVKELRLAIVDLDHSPDSRFVMERLMHARAFTVVAMPVDPRAILPMMDRGEIQAAVTIPLGFQKELRARGGPAIQVLVDGIDGNTAGIALGYVNSIIQDLQVRFIGTDPLLSRQMQGTHMVSIEHRFWYNPQLESRLYTVPGIIALILTIITTFLTSMGLVREKELGTLEQVMVTPISGSQLLLGKILPFAILGFVEIMISMAFVYFIFDIGVVGSIPLLLAESVLFILTTLGLGMLVSTVAETQQQAVFLAWFFMIFMILLSGFFIPIENMPTTVQWLSSANPLRYYITVVREIYLKGAPLDALWRETLAMAGFGFVVFSLAVWRFRRRLSWG